MAKIGNFGKVIVFSVSNKKILTFEKLNQSITAKWNNHARIGNKPKSEFLGADLRSVSFTITLHAQHGVKPRKTMEAIEKAIETGRVEKLVIGGKAVGKNKWKITNMSESWDVVLSKGELAKATLSLTLEEYV